MNRRPPSAADLFAWPFMLGYVAMTYQARTATQVINRIAKALRLP